MDWIKLLLRLTFGGFMLFGHGIAKLSKFADSNIRFPDPLGIGTTLSLSLTVFSEVACSALLILGLFTRFASVPLLVTMLVAVFIVHSADPLISRELGVLYLAVFISITVLGPGKYSLDFIIRKKK